jgi:hypothetical protein
MSIYAVVLRTVKDNPGLTAAQLEATIPAEADGVTKVLTMLVADSRITQTGTGPSATYASISNQ